MGIAIKLTPPRLNSPLITGPNPITFHNKQYTWNKYAVPQFQMDAFKTCKDVNTG